MRSPDEIRLLSELLEHGMDLDAQAREGWIAGLQGDSLALVPSLRVAFAQLDQGGATDLLERGVRPTDAGVEGPKSGDVVGPYRLQRQLGTGGMGEVWLAERADGQLSRQVALKLPTVGLRRAVLVERFARERDILGSLVHPHIARLYDAGFGTDGQPWLALEYVEGTSIVEWCDAHALSTVERLRLFRQVLGAVHYAHARLVLHRDLKPANILVNQDGEVRLLDFGIAKLLDAEGTARDSALTQDAGRPMTLHYASPEQLLGKPLTTACDVYALGVVLYELLAGVRPYEPTDNSAAALQRTILEDDPRPPSRRTTGTSAATSRLAAGRLSPLLVRDADAMVLKAMAKEPDRRYASAEAFDADVGRWLENKPLEACPPTITYRVGKFVRRYRGSVLSAALAGLAIVATAAVAVALGLQARQEAGRAVAARDFVFDLFDRSGPPTYKGLAVTAKEILHAAAVQVDAAHASDPRLRAELLGSIARVHDSMELYDEATPLHDALIGLLRARGESRLLAQALLAAAESARLRRDTPRAMALVNEAAPLVDARPRDEPLQASLALARAWLALDRIDLAGADALFTGVLQRLQAAPSDTPGPRIEAMYGQWLSRRERMSEAESNALFKPIAEATSGSRYGPVGHRTALVRLQADFEAGHLARLPRLADLVAICLTPSRPTETCLAAREIWVETMVRLGQPSGVATQAERLLAALAEATDPIARAFLAMPLARFAHATGAGAAYDPARAQLRQLAEAGRESRDLVAADLQAQVQLTQAEIDVGEGRVPDAVRYALSIAEEPVRPNDGRTRQVTRARVLLGVIAAMQGQEDESLRRFAEAEEAAIVGFGTDHPELARVRMNHAAALFYMGHPTAARTLADAAVPRLETAWGAGAASVLRMKALRDAMVAGAARHGDLRTADFFL